MADSWRSVTLTANCAANQQRFVQAWPAHLWCHARQDKKTTSFQPAWLMGCPTPCFSHELS